MSCISIRVPVFRRFLCLDQKRLVPGRMQPGQSADRKVILAYVPLSDGDLLIVTQSSGFVDVVRENLD